MSKIEEQVIEKIRQRAEVGEKKYGTTMERTDFTDAKWLQELQAELLDGAIYAEKLLMLIQSYDKVLELKNQAPQPEAAEAKVKCPIPLEQWPKWAKWAAMYENESWYFYESKPNKRKNVWSKMLCEPSIFKGSDFPWHETLTHRSELENQKQ